MKNEKSLELNVPAFAVAGGVVGLLTGWVMPTMMGFGYGMMGGGIGFLNVGMALGMGIGTAIFAFVYNWFCGKM